jgi:signal transduction histidine kinase
MIGNIAHQWRQPLNTLGLLVQELQLSYECGQFSGEALEKSVDDAMQVIRHMSQTIDDFRHFFQTDREKVTFRVAEVVDKVVNIVGASLKQHRIELTVSASGEAIIHGYPNEYSQVLLNILLNAKDVFGERNVAQPRIELQVYEEEGKAVVLIDDNAGGIPAQIVDKIFDPYFTTKSPDKGTGVGLHMSKTIIEKNMKGSLTARNHADGARFRIEV